MDAQARGEARVGRRALAVVAPLLALSVLAGALSISTGCRNRGDAEDAGEESANAEPAPGTAAEEPASATEHHIVLYFPGSSDDRLHGETRTSVPIAAPAARA